MFRLPNISNPQRVPKIKRLLRRSALSLKDFARYHVNRKMPHLGKMEHIVFVCQGNVCRSAFAEYYLKSVISNMSNMSILVESCGLDVTRETLSPPDAVQVAKFFGVDLKTHRSKGILSTGIQTADMVIAMEYQHVVRLRNMFPELAQKIYLLSAFAPLPYRLTCNIYDPFGLGEAELASCFSQVARAVDSLNRQLIMKGKGYE
ncbi:arsenate reductase/protein-tyrosine-phosphatase family protein [Geomonas anaerohicana]|uniref:protein-tyrosine-phosphatase n=1 Tax=Geomonas anaerohicana TaxID=2798583 RepID=A0ABS0YBY7_9BACT|nr:hypothetical protein [Geomonas anaerohicana]MBJ6749823.1 hypothetical protein [Geomonas anaerohicana]